MFDNSRSVRAGLRAVTAVAVLGALVGFAPPTTRTPAPARMQSATVLVRDFPGAGSVTILAWNPGAPTYGLRTDVPRTGSAWRYHWLFVAANSVPDRDMARATLANRTLKFEGSMRDDQNCAGGKGCTPPEYFSARIPDDVLRGNLDGVSVTFLTKNGNELVYKMRRDVVDAYLASVDSVRAAFKK